jgi:hypothetical protein
MDVSLPPFLRRLQQSPLVQLILIPAIITAVPAVIQCAGNDFANMSLSCLKLGAAAAVVYIVGMLQHSPGSATFNANGTDNQQVAEVVAADKALQPVAVVPVASAAAREEIRTTVKDAAVKSVVVAPAATEPRP